MRVFGLRKVRGFPQFSFSSRFRRPRILFLGHRFWSVSAMVPHLVLCRSWPSRPCVGCCCCRSLVFLLCFAGHLFWPTPSAVRRLVPARVWSYFPCMELVGCRVFVGAGQELLFSAAF